MGCEERLGNCTYWKVNTRCSFEKIGDKVKVILVDAFSLVPGWFFHIDNLLRIGIRRNSYLVNCEAAHVFQGKIFNQRVRKFIFLRAKIKTNRDGQVEGFGDALLIKNVYSKFWML